MTAAVTVRHFRQEDFDRILLIENASFGEDAYDRNLFAEFQQRCSDLFLVAEREGFVCGYIVSCLHRRRGLLSGELVSLAVDPAARGLGIASRLLNRTLRRLRRQEVDRLTLMVRLANDPARALYEKYGFRRVRRVRRYYADGADGLLMKLPLRPNA